MCRANLAKARRLIFTSTIWERVARGPITKTQEPHVFMTQSPTATETARSKTDHMLRSVKRALRRVARVVRTNSTSNRPEPLLSVIVPVYNVEKYLADCLESILAQSYRELQIILIDDGSPDNSIRIARKFAKRDSRVQIVRQKNAGLGSARNKGLDRAKGDYITFVDSDDTIPAQAFSRMVNSLESTGSDLATGAFERLRDGKKIRPEWVDLVHSQERLGVRLGEFPQVLRDFYTPGKVFRRSLWVSNNLRFRERVLFEDQPIVTQAYVAAGTIDILKDVTYNWLIRSDGSSLSQSMYTEENVQSRKVATLLTEAVLSKTVNSNVFDAWLWTLLEFHFPSYLGQALRVDEHTYTAIVDMVSAVIGQDDLARIKNVSFQNRLLIHLALNGPRADVETFLLEGGRDPRNYRTLRKGTLLVAHLPAMGDMDARTPDDLFVISDHQLKLSATLRSVEWVSRTSLKLTGWAYIFGAPLAQDDSAIDIELVEVKTGVSIFKGSNPKFQ